MALEGCDLKKLLTSTADLLKTPLSIYTTLTHTNMICTCVHSPIALIATLDTHLQKYAHTLCKYLAGGAVGGESQGESLTQVATVITSRLYRVREEPHAVYI